MIIQDYHKLSKVVGPFTFYKQIKNKKLSKIKLSTSRSYI